MALIQNENGYWAWTSDPSVTPKRFYATKDEAVKNADIPAGETRDSVDRCYTREKGEFVSQ